MIVLGIVATLSAIAACVSFVLMSIRHEQKYVWWMVGCAFVAFLCAMLMSGRGRGLAPIVLSIPGLGIGGMIVLVVGICRRKLREWNRFTKVYLIASACLGATFVAMVITDFDSPRWKGDTTGWPGCLDEGAAAWTFAPLWLLHMAIIGVAIWVQRFRRGSHVPFLAAALTAVICLWEFLMWPLDSQTIAGQEMRAIGYGVMTLAYCLLAVRFWRELAPDVPNAHVGLRVSWVAAMFASIAAKIPLAMSFFEQLPDEFPESNCFIVSASAQGHPSVVKSEFDLRFGYRCNQQLRNFRLFEDRLRRSLPRTHECLRAVYNRVGPVIARMLVCRGLADLCYLSLKPLEWFAMLLIRK